MIALSQPRRVGESESWQEINFTINVWNSGFLADMILPATAPKATSVTTIIKLTKRSKSDPN